MRLIRTHAGLAVLLAVALLGGPGAAWAQEISSDSRTFGTDVSTTHTVQAFAFASVLSTDSYGTDTFYYRFCTSTTPCRAVAPVLLPAGALVTALELEACDTSGAKSAQAQLIRLVAAASTAISLATSSSGVAATPDCARFFTPLGIPETIDNFTNTYVVQIDADGTDNTVRFQAVRIYYRLQVSPAPSVATFNDVSTGHPFFQWIEALAASGITRGCSLSPPLFCPNDPVTRGEIAVFLSRALGLQFSP